MSKLITPKLGDSFLDLYISKPIDELLRQVLVKLFADRQILVDKNVVDYLLNRMERSLSAARRIVDVIDHRALAENRRISRSFVGEVLAGLGGGNAAHEN